jgi:hypothetical protein
MNKSYHVTVDKHSIQIYITIVERSSVSTAGSTAADSSKLSIVNINDVSMDEGRQKVSPWHEKKELA